MEASGVLGFKEQRLFRETVRGKVRGFEYSTPLTNVLASSSAQATIGIESASHFFACYITGRVLDANGLVLDFTTVAQPNIAIQDTSSGAFLEDKETRWQNLVGWAEYPHELKPPFFLRARSTIIVLVTNAAAAAINFQVTLTGFKSYVS